MNTKHTPGPWQVGNTPTKFGSFNASNVTAKGTDDAIAMVYGIPHNRTVEEVMQDPSHTTKTGIANARRIVECVNACEGIADPTAVPELLDICESILAEVDYEGLQLESGRIAKLRAAIAKATGTNI